MWPQKKIVCFCVFLSCRVSTPSEALKLKSSPSSESQKASQIFKLSSMRIMSRNAGQNSFRSEQIRQFLILIFFNNSIWQQTQSCWDVSQYWNIYCFTSDVHPHYAFEGLLLSIARTLGKAMSWLTQYSTWKGNERRNLPSIHELLL